MDECVLEQYLNKLPIPNQQKYVFLDYLCADNGEFIGIKELSKKHNISPKRARQIVDRYTKYIRDRSKNEALLTLIQFPLSDLFITYKGAMTVSGYLKEAARRFASSDLSLKRMLGFAELVTKSICFNKDKTLFWDSKSPCIKCKAISEYAANLDPETKNPLDKLAAYCRMINCSKTRANRFHEGQLEHLLSLGAIFKKDNRETRDTTKDPTISPSPTTQIAPGLFDSEQSSILEFIIEREAKVPLVACRSFCNARHYSFNDLIHSINSVCYDRFGADLVLISDEHIELSDIGLPKILQQIEAELSEPNQLSADKLLIEFRHHKEMLSNSLGNCRQSYKFYWAMSLVDLITHGNESSTMKKMASLMCAYAWKDVLVESCPFRGNDLLPIIIRKIYEVSYLNKYSTKQDIQAASFDLLSSQEINDLTRTVSVYFNETYTTTVYIKGKLTSVSIPLYKIDGNEIVLDKDECSHVVTNTKALNDIIESKKNRYFMDQYLKQWGQH
jgi:hypothetical protein